MLKTLIILACIFYGVSPSEDFCLIDAESMKLPIQVAFVIDRSVVDYERSEWTLFQNETIHHLMPAIEKKFSGSEFAVTAFSDWPDDNQTHTTEELETCYTTVLPFITDQLKLMQSVNSLKQIQNQYTKHGGGLYYALMSTAADLRLGWKENKDVRKVVVLFTDVYPLTDFEGSTLYIGRGDSVGDGTDTCTKSLPPNPRETVLEWTLIKKEILVVGVYLRMDENSIAYYDHDFGYLHVPYVQYTVPKEKQEITKDLLREFDYHGLANTITDWITKELQICEFSDPPAYNTFGL